MSEFFTWLAGSAVTLIALYVTWYVFVNSMRLAEKGPKGVVMVIISLVIVFIGAGYVVVPALNELYLRIRTEVSTSQIAADVISVAGAVPGDFQVGPGSNTGPGSPSTGNQVPISTTPTIYVVAPPTPALVAADTSANIIVFPQVNNLRVIGDTLTIEGGPEGITSLPAAQIENVAACGWYLERMDVNRNPTHLLACPAEDLIIFSASQVEWRAAGVPLPPPVQPTATPRFPAEVGVCWAQWANSIEFGNLTAEGDYRSYLPAGTTWVITSPGGINLRPLVNQPWTLTNAQFSITYSVNGIVGQGLGGQGGGANVTVYGTGVWPPGCQP